MNEVYYWLIGMMILSALVTLFLPKIKGFFGEASVAATLSMLPKEEYRLLNNIMLKTERGTTQIDHIVLSLYGIEV